MKRVALVIVLFGAEGAVSCSVPQDLSCDCNIFLSSEVAMIRKQGAPWRAVCLQNHFKCGINANSFDSPITSNCKTNAKCAPRTAFIRSKCKLVKCEMHAESIRIECDLKSFELNACGNHSK